MKNLFPILAALLLVTLWLAMLYAIPRTLLQLPQGPLGVPPLPTLVTSSLYWLVGRTIMPLLVLATACLIGFRQFVGWLGGLGGLVLCVAWDVAFLGLLIPIRDNFQSGSIPNPSFPLFPALVSIQTGLAIGAFILNKVLLVYLILKRRDFAR